MSKLVQDCFKPIIESDIKEKLANSPFSLIIDNSTFAGSNICALKVKYFNQVWQEELRSEITTMRNKIIALSDLDERSDGKTLKEIVENKLLNHKRIKKNLIGLAHDNASSLTSEDIGLASLLKKDDCHFFDLLDPCHGLNLVLKHSIKELPEEIMNFVQNISNHFASPQRKAHLRKIQEETERKTLYPKKLAPTRWLSIGESLGRILEIWDSLLDYFKVLNSREKPAKKTRKTRQQLKINQSKENSLNLKKVKSKEILKYLVDKEFHMKILLLSYITNLLNKYNIKFQDQTLSVSEIKKNLSECYFSFLELVLDPNVSDLGLTDSLKQDWEDVDTQEELFFKSKEFITI